MRVAQPRSLLFGVGLLLALLCSMASLARAEAEPEVPGSGGLDLADLKAFTEAWARIKEQYVEPVDDRRLLEAALRGMVAELDPHSAWLDRARFEEVQAQATGHYGGLGMRVSPQEAHLRIESLTPGSAAELGGLRAGDRIVAVDGRPVAGLDTDRLSQLLRGEPGSRVRLEIERGPRAERLAMELTRQIIRRDSVHRVDLNDGLMLIGIDSFQQSTPAELDRALAWLDGEPSLRGLILDLRGNPGGMLQSAIAVADRFLDEGLIVRAEGRGPENQEEYVAEAGQFRSDLPMAVLIDGETASAAEIVAAALRDHERATLIGQTSYGKASVQSIWPLPNGSGIRLTTARYRTPSGQVLEGSGLAPDLPVPVAVDDPLDRELERAIAWLNMQLEATATP